MLIYDNEEQTRLILRQQLQSGILGCGISDDVPDPTIPRNTGLPPSTARKTKSTGSAHFVAMPSGAMSMAEGARATRVGLLGLPAEIRKEILRQLLVLPVISIVPRKYLAKTGCILPYHK